MAKKLIEVSIPLDDINRESAREKSIRHGHPSTLHLWWARRPLATARAVLWASLVDDPDDDTKREKLFAILRKLVMWENTNNPDVLRAARAALPDNLPELLDPFAGGGSIPLEGQRLGLKVHAHDLNPVAVLINRAMIQIPPKFAGQSPINPDSRRNIGHDVGWDGASGLAEDVRYYGERLKEKAFAAVGHMYPKIATHEGTANVIAWIWARTVKCPNPACGCEVPLVSSFVLSSKKGHEVYAAPVIKGGRITRYEVRQGKDAPEATKTGKGKFRCCVCGAVLQNDYLHRQFMAGRDGRVMIAVVAEGRNGRVYLSPTYDHETAADVPLPEDYPEGQIPERALGFRVQGYGFTHWHQLFTNRQLTMLTAFSDLITDTMTEAEHDAQETGRHDPKGYAQAVGVYLAFAVDKLLQYHSAFSLWDKTRDGIAMIFSRQAIPMVWNYPEANPFCNSTGSYDNMLEWIVEVIKELPATSEGEAQQADAQSQQDIKNVMISTDPPYYDNIGYADLSDYFYIWLRRTLKDIYPDIFKTMLVPKAQELIATPYRHGNSPEKARRFFEEGMKQTCKRLYEYARDDVPTTIYYAYKQSDTDNDGTASSGWETMLNAIIEAGFTITGTWPMRTELTTALKATINALASSIVLVCRKRPSDAPATTRRNFTAELRREIPPALSKLQSGSIAPVDLPQSAIGPGMAVYSKYSAVLDSDGTAMTVRGALQAINRALDEYLGGQEMDDVSRFCVELYVQKGFETVSYDDALKIARAKNVSIEGLKSQGIVFAEKGKVHLTEKDKLTGDNSCVWVLVQRLAHAMSTGGRTACAKVMAGADETAKGRAKQLAYRLYTIADRRKQAQEALWYNSLVVEWKDIEEESKKPLNQQLEIHGGEGNE